jgi:predicted ATPase
MFAEQLEEHVTQLAHHYSHSADSKKALHYLQRAAQYAVQRSANAEAIVHLETALALVETLSDSAERLREEVTLQFALTVPMLISEGPGSSQAEKAYKRARELCEQIEEPGRLAPVLWGLFLMYLFRAEHTTALEVAEELRRLGENANDSRILLWGHYAMGASSCWLGELGSTLHHLQQTLAQYDSDDRRSYTLEYGQDPGIGCPSLEVLVSWISGYPDHALTKTRETFALARELSHPWSIGYAGFFAAWVHQLCGEVATSQELAETVIAVCTEHGIPTWLTFATAINGGALVAQGRPQEGIREIHDGIDASRSLGSVVTQSYLLGLLAEGHLAAGEADQGLVVLAEALDMVAKTQERFCEAELYRLKGELTLHSQGLSPRAEIQDEAKECFHRAIEIARRQQAKSWELRATMSLARLLDKQGRREEARPMLADIYNWFTEGFDTADPIDAKTLLGELSG